MMGPQTTLYKTLKHKLYQRVGRTVTALLHYDKPYQSFLYGGKYIEGKVDTVRMYYSLGLSSKIKDKSWLDLGCNEGSICLLAAQDGARPVMGVDYDTRYIANARERAKAANQTVSFVQGNVVDVVKNSEQYDVITMFAMFRHIYRHFMQADGHPLPKTGRALLVYNSFETLILGLNNPVKEHFDRFVSRCITLARNYLIVSINDHSGLILRNPAETKRYFQERSNRIRDIEIYNFSPQNPEYVIIKLTLSGDAVC